MEIIDIVYIFSGILFTSVPVSAIAGAIMGSKREIGGAKGMLAGLLMPGIGICLVMASKRKSACQHRASDNIPIRTEAKENAKEMFDKENPPISNTRQEQPRPERNERRKKTNSI